MVTINGVQYLCGPAGHLGKLPRDWKDTGEVLLSPGMPNKRVYQDGSKNYWLVWTPVNAQWDLFCACRTQAQLLRGWS